MRNNALDPATTVLLPIYFEDASPKNLHFLARALDSIADQRFPGPFEILIIDDGSPEPVEPLLQSVWPSRLAAQSRCIRSLRNGGLVDALNRGLAQSRYPFIARLDADDRWLPGKIERQFEQFSADEDLTISATGMRLVTPDEVPIETHVRAGDWNGILRFFIETGCPFPHGSVVARREILSLLGGYSHDPSTAHCEDYALWSIWLRFFKPAMVEQSLYDYTIHDGSVSIRHAAQQEAASRRITAAFRAQDPVGKLPMALSELADALGVPLIRAGTLAYRMWRYHLTVALPRSAMPPLRRLLSDRTIEMCPLASCTAVNAARVTGTSDSLQISADVAIRVM